MGVNLQIRPSTQQVAEAGAKHFVAAIPDRGSWHVALSGGRIAKPFYDAIVAEVQATRQNVDHIHFFFSDERCVPATDPESNFLTARQSLFDPLQIRAEQIHRIHGETDDTYAAQEAEAELCRIAPLDSHGQPILDFVVLGMGEDGHTASLFPGEPDSLINDTAVYRAVTAVKPPPRRITLGYAALQTSRQILLLANGGGKEPALRQLFAELRHKTPALPISRVLEGHQNALIISDIGALSKNFERNS